MKIKSICVFAGSADQLSPVYLSAARELGRFMAMRKINLVYGAGKTGMMGELANAALAAGGTVMGITPKNLNTSPLIHQGLTSLEESNNIQERKARMYQLADAFIALPGGYGTLDELFETLTWAQIGLHAKPVAILNIHGYYDSLIQWVSKASAERFIYPEHMDLFICDSSPANILDRLEQFQSPTGLDRWVTRQD
jgi:uncharacterized protein (TIGR00730 family)